jgi:hypothetical protein
MRVIRLKLVAVAFCSAVLATPMDAQAFGLGTVLGLVRGVVGGGLPMHHHHLRGPMARTHLAPEAPKPEAAKPPTPSDTTGPTRTEARLEAPPDRLQTAVQRQPPLAWPEASASVYEDLLGYILWPEDYAGRLWTHGYDDIVSAALMPAAARSGEMGNMIANGMCSSQTRELADKPIVRIAKALELRPDQRAALDEVRTGLGVAIERGRAALCGAATAPAGDRFKPMIDGLWTMWDATILMRTPLEKFYNSLTPAQKAQLASASPADAKAAGACAAQRTAEWPADRIQRAMGAGQKPTAEQRRSLEALQQRFTELAQFLATSCPQESDPDPILRLSAAGERMNALMYAVMTCARPWRRSRPASQSLGDNPVGRQAVVRPPSMNSSWPVTVCACGLAK